MKQVVHLLGKLPEFFFAQAIFPMRARKDAKSHDGAGKRATGTSCLPDAATETSTKLFSLFGRESSVKAVVKNQQQGFRTAEFQIRKEIFRPLFDKERNLIDLPGFVTIHGGNIPYPMGARGDRLCLRSFCERIVIVEQFDEISPHGFKSPRLAVIKLLCCLLVFFLEYQDQ
jgi:hypothetical protein